MVFDFDYVPVCLTHWLYYYVVYTCALVLIVPWWDGTHKTTIFDS